MSWYKRYIEIEMVFEPMKQLREEDFKLIEDICNEVIDNIEIDYPEFPELGLDIKFDRSLVKVQLTFFDTWSVDYEVVEVFKGRFEDFVSHLTKDVSINKIRIR